MVLLESVFVSILIGLIAGGKLRHLSRVPFRRGYLIIIAALMQANVVYSAKGEIVSGITTPAIILFLSSLLLVITCVVNLRLPGMYLISLGLLLNMTVTIANGGFMPVSPDKLQAAGFTEELSRAQLWSHLPRTKDILMPASEIRLVVLSDILVLTLPVPFHSRFTHTVMSIGDVVAAIGIFFLAQASLRSRLALLTLHPTRPPRTRQAPNSTSL